MAPPSSPQYILVYCYRLCERAWLTSPYLNIGENIGAQMVWEGVAHFALPLYRWEYWCVDGVRGRGSLHLTSISFRVLVCIDGARGWGSLLLISKLVRVLVCRWCGSLPLTSISVRVLVCRWCGSLHLTSISVRVLVCRWCERAWLTSPYLNIGENIGAQMVWEGVAHFALPQYRLEYWCV